MTEVIVVADAAPAAAGLHPLPEGTAPLPPDPVAAATEAMAVGVAIGEQAGRAEAAATDAMVRESEARAAQATAEAEATQLRERVTSLEALLAATPPMASEPEAPAATVVAAVDVTPAKPTADTPAPAKARGWLMTVLLG